MSPQPFILKSSDATKILLHFCAGNDMPAIRVGMSVSPLACFTVDDLSFLMAGYSAVKQHRVAAAWASFQRKLWAHPQNTPCN